MLAAQLAVSQFEIAWKISFENLTLQSRFHEFTKPLASSRRANQALRLGI